jgi:hypothetical protein
VRIIDSFILLDFSVEQELKGGIIKYPEEQSSLTIALQDIT